MRVFDNSFGSGTPGICISGGDLDANVTVTSNLTNIAQVSVSSAGKKLLSGRTLAVGGTLDGAMAFPNDGIVGQVVINSRNISGSWTANVTENSVALSPKPAYTNSSASIGGGAVGLLPFRIHPTDSDVGSDLLIITSQL